MSTPPIPANLAQTLPNSRTPWHTSPQVFSRLQFHPSQTDPYTKCALTPADPEWKFVATYFEHDIPINRVIKRIFCLHNPSSTARFEANIPIMEQESTNLHFAPTWHKESHLPLREKTFKRWESSTEPFSPFFVTSASGRKDVYKNVKLVPLWHGSTDAKCQSVAQTGFTFFGKTTLMGSHAEGSTDIGFFGSGIYFTNSARYAADIYSDGHLLLAWVAMREPFPVVSDKAVLPPHEPSDMKALKGKGAYKNYNAHYIPVISIDPSNKDCAIYYPCAEGQTPMCDEYAVFQPSQTLARFWVELDVALVKNPAYAAAAASPTIEELLDQILNLLDNPAIQATPLAAPLEEKTHVLLALNGKSPLTPSDLEFYNCTQKLVSEAGSVRSVIQKKVLQLLGPSSAPAISSPKLLPEQPPIVSKPLAVKQTLPPEAFGAEKWDEYFGLKVEEPALPANIHEILSGPCPIFPGKRVCETHLLTLIPAGMTLQRLESLTLNPRKGSKIGFRDKYTAWDQYKAVPTPKTHWVLLTNDVIPESRRKSWKDQQTLMQKYQPQGYELPSGLDVAISLLTTYVVTGQRYDSPRTYTRCVEKVKYDSSEWPLAIGAFSSGGLCVDCIRDGYDDSNFVGVGGGRKLI